MNDHGIALAAAAHKLIGSPFRLRGRDARTGVDCIGLIHCALLASGRTPPPIPAYNLRNASVENFMPLLPLARFRECIGEERAGDLVLMQPSAGQYHLALISLDHQLIHAHAGLRRVVKTPQVPAQRELGRWRLA